MTPSVLLAASFQIVFLNQATLIEQEGGGQQLSKTLVWLCLRFGHCFIGCDVLEMRMHWEVMLRLCSIYCIRYAYINNNFANKFVFQNSSFDFISILLLVSKFPLIFWLWKQIKNVYGYDFEMNAYLCFMFRKL